MIVWLQGNFLPLEEARIDPTDRGLTLGDGLYETIRVHGGKPLRFSAHCARLQRGTDLLGLPYPTTDLGGVIAELLSRNDLADALVRLTLTRGRAPRGLASPKLPQPTLLIAAYPFPGPVAPCKAIVATVTRRNQASPLSAVKHLSALDNILAKREAEKHAVDDAILCNTCGDLAESTIANLHIVKHGKILTPRVEDGALPGVMREFLISDFGVLPTRLVAADLLEADEVFLSNASGIRPVIAVDGQTIGSGEEGPMTARIRAAVN
jgi:branched-chain amino acid aminotransferase